MDIKTAKDLQTITIDNVEYYLGEELKELSPMLFKGSRNIREFIKKKEIDEKYWIYVKKNDNIWVKSNGKSIRCDKIALTKSWCIENIPGVGEIEEKYEMAPQLIELKDKEKLTDSDGNIYDIEVRGERSHNNCYFKASMVGDMLGIKRIDLTILDKGNKELKYVEKEDYKFFNCIICGKGTKKTNKKELYLTYTGVLRIIFSSHSPVASKFVKWASDVIFTHHLGTPEAKQKLSKLLTGATPAMIKDVFNITDSKTGCIYLFSLGTAKDVRNSLNIPASISDDKIIYKYGRTNDIVQRTSDHENTYGKLKNVTLRMNYFMYIDNSFQSKAEADIANYIKQNKIYVEHKEYKELCFLDSKTRVGVIDAFKKAGELYGGRVNVYNSMAKDLYHEIDKATITANKDKELYAKDKEISAKEIDNLNMKYELMMMKNDKEKKIIIASKDDEINKLKEDNNKLI